MADVDDLCVAEAEDVDQFEDEDGCPDPDNDQDRILDAADQCPNEPELWNGVADEDGCPDRPPGIIVETNAIRILDRVFYARGATEPPPEARPILDAIAATLTGNPQITLVEIQAHADERGGDPENLRATQRLADSVRRYLVSQGVAPERLRAVGYGERCPAAPGHDEDAWQQSRRVEFKIVGLENGEAEDPLPCEAARGLVPR